MKKRELLNLGLPDRAVPAALTACGRAGLGRDALRAALASVLADPASLRDDPLWGDTARAILGEAADGQPLFVPLDPPAPLRMWGTPGETFEGEAVAQIDRARTLPIAAAAALMPDAHLGYGLPIGGVLATRGAVIPYAVGVDIACRMKLTVLDLPAASLDEPRVRDRLRDAIEAQTRFGVGAAFGRASEPGKLRQHAVMDEDWSVSPVTQRLKDKAWTQLGTSGSGNHFVEFGVLTVPEAADHEALGLSPGEHLALLSHSGSRGAGAAVCDHYSRLAIDAHPDLPPQVKYLAWLDLSSQAGAEYWAAMNLMGRYASANHACIHDAVVRHLGATAVAGVENHHNFAWAETHDLGDGPEDLLVHRKGATPAGAGVLGVIPGSMADPGFVVRGRGGAGSLDSASHGAGRAMSRAEARRRFRSSHARELLESRRIEVLSAGVDELPMVYKDINAVMHLQQDLVEILASFQPRMVKMAPEGEKAED
jgi:tRNA-splicing ligase RtcB